jgi:hypothetical protein
MSNDNDRKDNRRKKFNSKKPDNKTKDNEYGDFSYSKIKNEFKRKKQSIIEEDYDNELDEYYK